MQEARRQKAPASPEQPTLGGAFEGMREPDGDWQAAFTRLLAGRCPYCLTVIGAPTVRGGMLSWSCSQGCNP